ncbi:MAG: hypothetical protein CDV28_1479 [Candidatus Electronema aureum]|uniref:Uncharacterized protein n=1 Tax=Candidatus Electronema aureum TaxID=2005002 RepID=A0A521FYY3_9BACT|nr:MAG: hypothetical protein CDV28_1479 [Candidatus Electronema aureum]
MKSYEGVQKIIDQIRQERATGRQRRSVKIAPEEKNGIRPKTLGRAILITGKILVRTVLIAGSIFVVVSILLALLLLFVTSQQEVAKKEIKQQVAMNNENTVYAIKKHQIENETAYTKKEIIGYTIYLKNGKRISCKKTPTTQNGMMTIVEGRIKNEIPLSWVSKIEGMWQ